MHFVFGDVHGSGLELQELIRQFNPGDNDKIILVGDALDRGKYGHLVWELIHRHKMDCFMGNHEMKMLRFLQGHRDSLPLHYYWTLNNLYDHGITPPMIVEFIERLPLVRRYTDDNGKLFIVTHAGIDPYDPMHENVSYNVYANFKEHEKMPRPNSRDGKIYWWNLYLGTVPVYYGHLTDEEDSPEYNQARIRYSPSGTINSIGLDTGACHGGPLTAACVETGKIYQYRSHVDWFDQQKKAFAERAPVLRQEIVEFIANQRTSHAAKASAK